MIQLARENNVAIIQLPPHTTHKLQPLDVGVFGPFQRMWLDRCDEIVESTYEEVSQAQLVKEYLAIRKEAFKEATICAAWRKSGHEPHNPDIFTDADYAPSVPFSTSSTSLVPSTFPGEADRIAKQSASRPAADSRNVESDLESQSESDSSDTDEDEDEDDSDSSSSSDSSDSDSEDSWILEPTAPLSTIATLPHPDMLMNQPAAVSPALPSSESSHGPPPQQPVELNPPPALLSSSPVHPTRGMKRKRLEGRVEELEQQLNKYKDKTDFLEGHLLCAREKIDDLQHQMNSHDPRKPKRKVRVNSRYLTGRKGRAEVKAAEEQQAAKKKKTSEAKEARTLKQAQEHVARAARDRNEPFRGSLSSKKKAELQGVAYALQLSLDGTKETLVAKITNASSRLFTS